MNWASSTYRFWSSAVPVFDDLPPWGLPLRDRWHIVDGLRHCYPIYLSEAPGGVRLSDRGDTLMRISYDHDIDAFLAGSRGLLIERILGEERVGQDGGVFSSRTFCFRRWPKERIQRDHLLPDLPNAEAYPVDYQIGGQERRPSLPLRRSQPGQGPSDDHHSVSLSPAASRLRFDSCVQRSGRHTTPGPGKAVGCGRGHGLVAGVERGSAAEDRKAGGVGGSVRGRRCRKPYHRDPGSRSEWRRAAGPRGFRRT